MKMRVPRTQIPKAYLTCRKCGSGSTIRMASPYADGYMRRHVCNNVDCMHGFYSLAPYGGEGDIQVSDVPFVDRPMTEFEEDRRRRMFAGPVTSEVKPLPVIRKMELAMRKREGDRNEIEKYLAFEYDRIEKQLRKLDHALKD